MAMNHWPHHDSRRRTGSRAAGRAARNTWDDGGFGGVTRLPPQPPPRYDALPNGRPPSRASPAPLYNNGHLPTSTSLQTGRFHTRPQSRQDQPQQQEKQQQQLPAAVHRNGKPTSTFWPPSPAPTIFHSQLPNSIYAAAAMDSTLSPPSGAAPAGECPPPTAGLPTQQPPSSPPLCTSTIRRTHVLAPTTTTLNAAFAQAAPAPASSWLPVPFRSAFELYPAHANQPFMNPPPFHLPNSIESGGSDASFGGRSSDVFGWGDNGSNATNNTATAPWPAPETTPSFFSSTGAPASASASTFTSAGANAAPTPGIFPCETQPPMPQSAGFYAYCFERGKGLYTRLVPADNLPPELGYPAVVSDSRGMHVLPDPLADLLLGPTMPSSAASLAGIVASPVPSATGTASFCGGGSSSTEHPTDAAWHSYPQRYPGAFSNASANFVPQQQHMTPQRLPVLAHQHQHQRQTSKKNKVYCDKWVHEGTCAFTQQGCKFKHEMPHDRATQRSLGLFHGYPAWYKKFQSESGGQLGDGGPGKSRISYGGDSATAASDNANNGDNAAYGGSRRASSVLSPTLALSAPSTDPASAPGHDMASPPSWRCPPPPPQQRQSAASAAGDPSCDASGDTLEQRVSSMNLDGHDARAQQQQQSASVPAGDDVSLPGPGVAAEERTPADTADNADVVDATDAPASSPGRTSAFLPGQRRLGEHDFMLRFGHVEAHPLLSWQGAGGSQPPHPGPRQQHQQRRRRHHDYGPIAPPSRMPTSFAFPDAPAAAAVATPGSETNENSSGNNTSRSGSSVDSLRMR